MFVSLFFLKKKKKKKKKYKKVPQEQGIIHAWE
jgi:hypothetical protein